MTTATQTVSKSIPYYLFYDQRPDPVVVVCESGQEIKVIKVANEEKAQSCIERYHAGKITKKELLLM